MSWTLDTSGHLVSDGGQVNFKGEVKGDTKGNAIWIDSGDEIKEGKRSWRFNIGTGKGMWIGLGTEERFGPGYSLKGLLYGGPGNLSDGGSLVTGGWGPRFAEGDTVDMRMTLASGGHLSLEFGLNNSNLGTAFTIDNWTWGQARPVVSLSSAGASVTISSLKDEEFPTSASASSSEGVTGKWTCVTEDYSLSLSPMEGTNSVLGLSVRVGNSMNCKIEAREDGSWVMAGPAMSTQMMPPPQIYGEISGNLDYLRTFYSLELEKKVFSLFNGISNIARDGAGLRVSFNSGESHCYQPQARPESATREKVNWMN